MYIAVVILSIASIAEFVMAPINLWTGRTMPLFRKFTGFPDRVGTHVFAPVKLVGAVAVAVGLAVRPVGIVGAAILTAVCGVYLVRLAAPGRRDGSGVGAFLLFGSWAAALLIIQVVR